MAVVSTWNGAKIQSEKPRFVLGSFTSTFAGWGTVGTEIQFINMTLNCNRLLMWTAVKRLMREARELREPTELYYAQPLEVKFVLPLIRLLYFAIIWGTNLPHESIPTNYILLSLSLIGFVLYKWFLDCKSIPGVSNSDLVKKGAFCTILYKT